MPSVLITAFEPYDIWETNASWQTVIELTRELPVTPQITTRLYPVDFAKTRERLEQDLLLGFDYSIHLGQAPGATRIQLESVGINIGGRIEDAPEDYGPLEPNGPLAYQSTLPLSDWSRTLCSKQIPTQVSYHAGTFLCNATLYLAHHFSRQHSLPTQSVFIHLPLSPNQVISQRRPWPTMSTTTAAMALRLILDQIATQDSG